MPLRSAMKAVASEMASKLPHSALNTIARRLSKHPRVRAMATEILVDKYAYALPVRPRPASMAADYPTWNGLVDRRFSGRHLTPSNPGSMPKQVNMDSHLALFKRDGFVPSTDTSVLFAMFAQWFTDGFLRTKSERGPVRTYRLNESNHEIDLCQIYGQTEAQTSMLRAQDPDNPGRLKFQIISGEMWPAPLFERGPSGGWQLREPYAPRAAAGSDPGSPGLYTRDNLERVFAGRDDQSMSDAMAVGLEHGNSTIGHVVMNTLFLREHNRIADLIASSQRGWDDERVFQTARNVVIVELLHIVISDYIAHIAPFDFQLEITPGIAERKAWYRTNWIPVEFALLYRWHDLIPDELDVSGYKLPADRFRWCTKWIRERGFSDVLEAASKQYAGKIGLHNTHSSLMEVKRASLEMAAGCRLQGYNAYRNLCGLRPYANFLELTRDPSTASELQQLYGSIDELDWMTGIFAEGYGTNDMMGELMVRMVANDAFTQALTNPLISKALYNEATFSPVGMEIVTGTRRLSQVIARNTGLQERDTDSFTVQ